MRVLFISAHYGDVVYNCGGAIAQAVRTGSSCLVATVFAGSPTRRPSTELARRMQQELNLDPDYDAICRWDDLHAVGRLGGSVTHLNFLAAIHRRGPHGQPEYTTIADMSNRSRPPSEPLVASLAVQIDRLLATFRPKLLYVPMADGQHVDHRATRQAVARAAAQSFDGPSLRFYEEPQGVAGDPTSDPQNANLKSGLTMLSPGTLELKLAALAEYHAPRKAIAGTGDQRPAVDGWERWWHET